MSVNPLTPMGDQKKNFSLQYQYNIKQKSDENKDSPNHPQTNYTAESKENYQLDLERERV